MILVSTVLLLFSWLVSLFSISSQSIQSSPVAPANPIWGWRWLGEFFFPMNLELFHERKICLAWQRYSDLHCLPKLLRKRCKKEKKKNCKAVKEHTKAQDTGFLLPHLPWTLLESCSRSTSRFKNMDPLYSHLLKLGQWHPGCKTEHYHPKAALTLPITANIIIHTGWGQWARWRQQTALQFCCFAPLTQTLWQHHLIQHLTIQILVCAPRHSPQAWKCYSEHHRLLLRVNNKTEGAYQAQTYQHI